MSIESEDNFNLNNLFSDLPTVSNGDSDATGEFDVTKILRVLERAIMDGNGDFASSIVKILAQQKVPLEIKFLCTEDGQTKTIIDGQSVCKITLLITNGDHETGPISLITKPSFKLESLKAKITQLYKLPSENQLWTLDGIEMHDDILTLAEYNIKQMESQIKISIAEPVCVKPVAIPESVEYSLNTWACDKCTFENVLSATTCEMCSEETNGASNAIKFETYNELLNLSAIGRSPNYEDFNCPICFEPIKQFDGVTLQGCLHSFCLQCIQNVIDICETGQIQCPYRDDDMNCENYLLDSEIRDLLLPESYQKYLSKTIKLVECQMLKTMHCLKPNCNGWWERIDDSLRYKCPVCHSTNCRNCKIIHENETCDDYQTRIQNTETNDQSEEMLQKLLKDGQAMACPQCGAIIEKIVGGCDGLTCTKCKTELCWATKGRRWGLAGTGDTSGGCKCRFNGGKCHPSCKNCH